MIVRSGSKLCLPSTNRTMPEKKIEICQHSAEKKTRLWQREEAIGWEDESAVAHILGFDRI